MRTVKIKAIHLANYKGIKSFDSDISDKTFVSGVNGVGKSTLSDSIYDVLTDKMQDGSSTDNIRPHDENGKDIDRIDIVREINIEIDGVEYLLNKTTKQKWTRPRGCDYEEFSGNETSYSINGFEKSKKEYTEFIEASICKMDILTMVLNAQPFFNILKKSTAQARDTLTKLSGFSIEQFVAEHSEYADINNILKGESVENVLKKLRKDLKMQEKSLAESQSNLSYESDREVIEWTKEAELESAKANYAEACKVMDAYAELMNKASQLNHQKSDLEVKANKEHNDEVYRVSYDLDNTRRCLDSVERSKTNLEKAINEGNRKLGECKMQLETLEADKDKSSFCPTCGAEIPAFKRAEAWNSKYAELSEKITELESGININNAEYNKAIKDGDIYHAAEVELSARLNELKAMAVIVPDTEEYKNIIEELKEIDAIPCPIDERSKFSTMITQLETEKQHINIENSKKKSLIYMLTQNVKQNAQACATIEKNIDIIKNFSLDKNKALAESVNQYFEKFKFVFYDETMDGNVYETLKLMHNGTNLLNGLNRGASIEVEADLICGLQKMQDLQLPIIMDNTESLDSWRLPEYENQMIVIRRTDDETLTVKGE